MIVELESGTVCGTAVNLIFLLEKISLLLLLPKMRSGRSGGRLKLCCQNWSQTSEAGGEREIKAAAPKEKRLSACRADCRLIEPTVGSTS